MEKIKSWILEDKSINFLLLHAENEKEKLDILEGIVTPLFPDVENINFLDLLRFWENQYKTYY